MIHLKIKESHVRKKVFSTFDIIDSNKKERHKIIESL